MRPTDDAIVIAALLGGSEWQAADEIRGMLKRLGFDFNAQQVAAWLTRLRREGCPMFEGEDHWGSGWLEYRVTRFGRTQVANHFDGAQRLWRDA